MVYGEIKNLVTDNYAIEYVTLPSQRDPLAYCTAVICGGLKPLPTEKLSKVCEITELAWPFAASYTYDVLEIK